MTFIDVMSFSGWIVFLLVVIFFVILARKDKKDDKKCEKIKANYEKEEKKLHKDKEEYLKTFPDYEEWVSLEKIFVPYSDLWRKKFPSTLEAEEARKRFEELDHKFYKLGEEYDDASSELYRKYLDEKTEINSRRVL